MTPTDPSDRDLLVRLDERVGVIHDALLGEDGEGGINKRVRDLEDAHTHTRGWVAGAGVILGSGWALIEWMLHRGR
jgi:hypothetical protein